MAKRKRLTPARNSYLSTAEARATATPATGLGQSGSGSRSVGAAPIAQVASETSATAALEELSGVLANARAKGLMVEEIPLEAIDVAYLVRDRIVQDQDDMRALMESIRARGQQTPIEVVRLEHPRGGVTHGLISGWRRLTALNRLYKETSEPKFAAVRALVVQPETAADAYLAMVEENEIRVNLSHYERARIAVQALAEGVYPDQRKALLGLFLNVPRAKRSKIASFVTLVEALDDVLKFPTAIPEKLGLGLARRIEEDPSRGADLAAHLRATQRGTASEELEVLQQHLELWNATLSDDLGSDVPQGTDARAEQPSPAPSPISATGPANPPPARPAASPRQSVEAAPGVRLTFASAAQKIELSGTAVTADLLADLKAWLATR